MFELVESDIQKMCYAGIQLGDKSCSDAMKPYIYTKADDGIYLDDI